MKDYKLYHTELISDLKEMIKKCADRYGDKNAITQIKGEHDINETYAQLAYDISAFGSALMEMNLLKRHIALIGDNCYEWIVSYLSVVNGGGVIVPIDKDLPVNEIKYIAEHSETDTIIYTDRMRERILQLQNLLNDKIHFISTGDIPDKHLSFDTILEQGRNLVAGGYVSYLNVIIDPDRLCSILYTSGTTGTSKGVMLSHRNITSVIIGGLNHIRIGSSVLSVLPVHHSYESVCGIFGMLYNGTHISINDSLKNFTANLKRTKPTTLVLVPAFVEMMYKGIWDNAQRSRKDKLLKGLIHISNLLLKLRIDLRKLLFRSIRNAFGGKLQMILCGGAPLSSDLVKGFIELGILLMNGYGITECAPLVAANRSKFYNEFSVGIPVSCCKVRIDNPDQDGDGEILVKGTNVMLGYYKNEEATKEAFDKDGWFRTGDVGHLDDNGFLFITGRKKNLIVLKSGKNVYPEEIESYLLASKLIKEVVVYSKEEKEGRESALIAEIYPDIEYAEQNGITNLEQAISEEVKVISGHLPYYKRVSRMILRQTEFEKTSTRKIKRFITVNKSNNNSITDSIQEMNYVKPENDLQKLIEEAMCDTLKLDQISIDQDLFELGLDSLGVVNAAAALSENGIEINLIDIYKGRTIRDIDGVILSQKTKEKDLEAEEDYVGSIKFQTTKSQMKSVLLTGATGFLGSHILAELMDTTTAKVYCLVRNQQNLCQIMKLYFDDQYSDLIGERILPVTGDITKEKLGLSEKEYSDFAHCIDTTIHSAANVHHIVDIELSEKVNVFGTENVVKFAMDADSTYHHISTMAISGESVAGKTGEIVFDETKLFIGQDYRKNVYVQSKYKAEKIVLRQIKNGLKGRIYRVGNLTWRKDGKFQINLNENGFLMRLSAFKAIGAYPRSMSDYSIDFTPVNECAKSIVKIIESDDDNRIYHLYNPNMLKLSDVFRSPEIKCIEDGEFYDLILQNKARVDVSILMFYLKEFAKMKKTDAIVRINNDLTKKLLEKLGFFWSEITSEYVNLYVDMINKIETSGMKTNS